MEAQRYIKVIMADKAVKSGTLADNIGMDRQAFYNTLYRKTMQYSEAERIADALGCEIVWRDKTSGKEYN